MTGSEKAGMIVFQINAYLSIPTLPAQGDIIEV